MLLCAASKKYVLETKTRLVKEAHFPKTKFLPRRGELTCEMVHRYSWLEIYESEEKSVGIICHH